MTLLREGNLLAASRVVYRRLRTTSRIFILSERRKTPLSLLVWLPLNGNLNNYGILNCNITSNSVTLTNAGKTGKCATATAANLTITITVPNLATILSDGHKYTLSCWVKPTNNITNGWVVKLGSNQNGLWWALNAARWVWNENDNGKRIIGSPIADDFNNWHHLVTTVDKSISGTITIKNYVDGSPAEGYESFTWSNGSNAAPAGEDMVIYPYHATICDVRLYNNCLTPQEIKEIYKSLIVHYPLAGYPNSNILNKPLLRLPAEYQEVEYILNDSAGNAYLNLNYTPTVPFTSINMNGTVSISLLDNNRNFICTVGSSSHSHYFEVNATHKIGCYDIISADTVSNNERINFKVIIAPNRLTLTAWGNSAYLNNSSSTAYASSDDVAPVLLFRLADGYKGRNIKFYKYNLLENNVLNFYLIPCYRKLDNKPGMYDLVNDTFYTNAGTGEFIIGPLASIPDEYMAVDYLSMKRGSYIDTGISVTNTHLFNFKYSVQSIVQWYGPFQSYVDENSVTTRIIANSTSTTNVFVYFMSRAGSGGAPAVNDVYSGNNNIVEGYMNYNNTYLYNHTTKKEFNITNTHIAGTASTAHMRLSSDTSSAGRAKIYYFDTYNNGLLILALRPVIRISDRKPGMYDLVTGTFFINQGSDEEFIYAINGIEYDISGLKNEKTTEIDLGAILTSANSIRYPKSLIGNSTTPWLKKTDFTFLDTKWTTSIWYYLSANPANLTFFVICNGNGDVATRKAGVVTNTATPLKLSIVIEGGTNPTVETTLNEWHHIALTSDGTTGSYYYDGELAGTVSVTKNIVPVNLGIGIKSTSATFSTSAWPFTSGQLSDFRMYATCFSANEIKELYNMGRLS